MRLEGELVPRVPLLHMWSSSSPVIASWYWTLAPIPICQRFMSNSISSAMQVSKSMIRFTKEVHGMCGGIFLSYMCNHSRVMERIFFLKHWSVTVWAQVLHGFNNPKRIMKASDWECSHRCMLADCLGCWCSLRWWQHQQVDCFSMYDTIRSCTKPTLCYFWCF